jgi:hypothetical protein
MSEYKFPNEKPSEFDAVAYNKGLLGGLLRFGAFAKDAYWGWTVKPYNNAPVELK